MGNVLFVLIVTIGFLLKLWALSLFIRIVVKIMKKRGEI